MTPFAIFTAGLRSLSSWVMAILAMVAVLVSVIICLVLAELVYERGALAQAYTVKSISCDEYAPSGSQRDKI
jgi:hypothetical protein